MGAWGRRSALALIATALGATAGAAQAGDGIKLFKLVSPRDEVVVGVSEAELRAYGLGSDLDNLAHRLVAAGQMSLWQYAVSRGPEGDLRQAPLRRIAVFQNDLLRIEPYATPLPVLPPQAP